MNIDELFDVITENDGDEYREYHAWLLADSQQSTLSQFLSEHGGSPDNRDLEWFGKYLWEGFGRSDFCPAGHHIPDGAEKCPRC